MKNSISSVMHPLLAEALADWRALLSKCGPNPELKDLRDAFTGKLDSVAVVEAHDDVYQYVYYGASFRRNFGRDLTGKYLNKLDVHIIPEYSRHILEFEYSYALHHNSPIWRSYTASFNGRLETWQRLTMPIMGRWLGICAFKIETDAEWSPTSEFSEGSEFLRMVLEAVPVVLRADGSVNGLALNLADISHWRMREEELEKLATTDALTGLANRRNFNQTLRQELQRARRYKNPLSVLALDIDHFKVVNDTYGHSVGDQALCHVAKLIRTNLRELDLPARMGGEEFAVLLPEIGEDGAIIVAEKIRKALEKSTITMKDGSFGVTVSIGIACSDGSGQNDGMDLLEDADKALYQAKDTGRNRVVLHK